MVSVLSILTMIFKSLNLLPKPLETGSRAPTISDTTVSSRARSSYLFILLVFTTPCKVIRSARVLMTTHPLRSSGLFKVSKPTLILLCSGRSRFFLWYPVPQVFFRETVPWAPTTIGIIVTSLFHIFNSLRVFSIFYFIFILLSAKAAKSPIAKFYSSVLTGTECSLCISQSRIDLCHFATY